MLTEQKSKWEGYKEKWEKRFIHFYHILKINSLLAFPKRGSLRGRKLMLESRRKLLNLNIYVLHGFFHPKQNRNGFAVAVAVAFKYNKSTKYSLN